MRFLQPSTQVAAAFVVGILTTSCASTSEGEAALPRRSLDDARATLPAPSAERAFVFDGEIEHVGGREKGRFRVSVEPGFWQQEAAWYVVEEDDEKLSPQGFETPPERRTSWVSRELRFLSGEHAGEDALPTVAGALLFFRAVPAEPAAFGSPPDCPLVSAVAPDGTMTCSAPLGDFASAEIKLRGRDRAPLEIVRRSGWNQLGRVVPRAAPSR